MKKWLTSVFFVLILVLGACGGGGNEEEPSDGGTTDENTEQDSGDSMDEGTDEGMDEGSEDSSGEEGGDMVDAEAAESVFQNNCASCHGGDLGGGVGPSLQEVGSKYSADEIVDIIKNGKGQMPKQGAVSDDDAQLVASWLETMK
ncbi:c-type cytochrome [Halobacillus salinus]|uniref:c-type cytochrome n=1 Tax=Halobacillus salinus TaxID=192814 RepID=UPI0009A6AD56|nr:cytochrome c [Halobacillus salinus]